MTIEKTFHFNAPPSRVWDILTLSEYSRQYMFGCAMLTDWKVGSDLIWEGLNQEGRPHVYVTGKVLAYEPNSFLKFSLFPAGAAYPDIPENRLHQSYKLSETDNGTQVQLLQVGFDTVADGQKRFEDASQGWEMIIGAMQKLV